MNLHRTSGKPDWADVKESDMNFWQRLSSNSNSILSPGNMITVIGFLLVVYGLFEVTWHHYLAGMLLVLIGRAADVLDGWVAEKTQTKSPLGETMDATLDKFGVFFTFIAWFTAHIAPAWTLWLLMTPQIINTLLSLRANHEQKRLHPSKVGKLSMVALLVTLLAFILIKAIPLTNSHYLDGAIIFSVLSSALGYYSSFGYIKDYLSK